MAKTITGHMNVHVLAVLAAVSLYTGQPNDLYSISTVALPLWLEPIRHATIILYHYPLVEPLVKI